MQRLGLLLGAIFCVFASHATACTHTGVAAVACPDCNAYAAPQALPVQDAADACVDQQVQEVAVPVQTYATVRVVQRQYVGLPAVRALPVQSCPQPVAVQQLPAQSYQSYQAIRAFPVTATPVFAGTGHGFGYGGVNTFGTSVGYNRGFRSNGVGSFAGNSFGAGGGGTVNINTRKFKIKRSQVDGLFNSGQNVNINTRKFKIKRSQLN